MLRVECPVCYTNVKNPVFMECQHFLCFACANKWYLNSSRCPICREISGYLPPQEIVDLTGEQVTILYGDHEYAADDEDNYTDDAAVDDDSDSDWVPDHDQEFENPIGEAEFENQIGEAEQMDDAPMDTLIWQGVPIHYARGSFAAELLFGDSKPDEAMIDDPTVASHVPRVLCCLEQPVFAPGGLFRHGDPRIRVIPTRQYSKKRDFGFFCDEDGWWSNL